MKFAEYLRDLKPKNDANGDFVRIVRREPSLPDVSSWNDIVRMMQDLGAPSEVVWAGEEVWRDYVRADARAERALLKPNF